MLLCNILPRTLKLSKNRECDLIVHTNAIRQICFSNRKDTQMAMCNLAHI